MMIPITDGGSTVDELINAYLDAISGVLAPATVDWYRRSLAPLHRAYAGRDIETITLQELRRWRRMLLETRAPTTVHGYYRAARRLFRWAVEEGYLDVSPMVRMRPPRIPDRPPKHLTDEDLARVLAACRRPRDEALVRFLADTGCRVGGLVGMTPDDLHLNARRARVVEKGGKTRRVAYGHITARALAAYLMVRPAGAGLWMGTQGPLTRYGVDQLLKRLAQRGGATGVVSAHAFRHRFARVWLERGGNMAILSQALGHADTVITAKYYARWSEDEVLAWHDRVAPGEIRVDR